MILSLEKSELVKYVSRQLDSFFPDGLSVKREEIDRRIDLVLDRANTCFSAIHNHYYQRDGQIHFNHLHSNQYASFLYLLGNTLYREGADTWLCEKTFYLNKSLNGIDAFYEVELPDIFCLCHPLRSVLGRASYSDYLLVYQGCTIGASHKGRSGETGVYPTLGKFCTLYAGASIIGDCHVADNCKISAHSLLLNQDLEPNKIYIGNRLAHVVKENKFIDNIWQEKRTSLEGIMLNIFGG